MLLYTAAIYLIGAGLLLLLAEGDIYIGFLWVIDLGVGLVFFIFILHFTSFLYQKSSLNFSARHFFTVVFFIVYLVIFFYNESHRADTSFLGDLGQT
jgi:hypothetical protein